MIISFAADCGGRMKQKNLIGILLIAVFVVVTGIIFGTGQERGESSRMLESAAITDTQDTGETEKQKETETETETEEESVSERTTPARRFAAEPEQAAIMYRLWRSLLR